MPNIVAPDSYLSQIRGQQSGNHFERGGYTSAVGSPKAVNFSTADNKRQRLYSLELSKVLG